MKTALDFVVGFLILFWPMVLFTSAMMFGAPGAVNNKSNIFFVLGVLSYPIGIFLVYFVLRMNFFGIKPLYPFLGSIVVVVGGCLVFGYGNLLINAISGLNSQGYTLKEGKVYYNAKLIDGADMESFEFEGFQKAYYFDWYSKDKNNVYFKGELIQGANPKSFAPVKSNKQGVHQSGYFADQNKVYFEGKPLPDVDPQNLEVFENGKIKAGTAVYIRDQKLPVDATTYEFLEGNFGKDKDHIYYSDKKILPMADPASFTLEHADAAIAFDKNNVYRMFMDKSFHIKEADRESFKMAPGIDSPYYLDKNNVYYIRSYTDEFKVLKEANPESFKSTHWDEKTKSRANDGTHFYFEGKLVQ